jgi:hypothetical protein
MIPDITNIFLVYLGVPLLIIIIDTFVFDGYIRKNYGINLKFESFVFVNLMFAYCIIGGFLLGFIIARHGS